MWWPFKRRQVPEEPPKWGDVNFYAEEMAFDGWKPYFHPLGYVLPPQNEILEWRTSRKDDKPKLARAWSVKPASKDADLWWRRPYHNFDYTSSTPATLLSTDATDG
jgi:hypothetical protein